MEITWNVIKGIKGETDKKQKIDAFPRCLPVDGNEINHIECRVLKSISRIFIDLTTTIVNEVNDATNIFITVVFPS